MSHHLFSDNQGGIHNVMRHDRMMILTCWKKKTNFNYYRYKNGIDVHDLEYLDAIVNISQLRNSDCGLRQSSWMTMTSESSIEHHFRQRCRSNCRRIISSMLAIEVRAKRPNFPINVKQPARFTYRTFYHKSKNYSNTYVPCDRLYQHNDQQTNQKKKSYIPVLDPMDVRKIYERDEITKTKLFDPEMGVGRRKKKRLEKQLNKGRKSRVNVNDTVITFSK